MRGGFKDSTHVLIPSLCSHPSQRTKREMSGSLLEHNQVSPAIVIQHRQMNKKNVHRERNSGEIPISIVCDEVQRYESYSIWKDVPTSI